jgi:hypothetical protein
MIFPKAFPTTVGIGSAIITLHADGTWSGDGPAFLKALSEMTTEGVQMVFAPTLWLVANAIRRDLNERS